MTRYASLGPQSGRMVSLYMANRDNIQYDFTLDRRGFLTCTERGRKSGAPSRCRNKRKILLAFWRVKSIWQIQTWMRRPRE